MKRYVLSLLLMLMIALSGCTQSKEGATTPTTAVQSPQTVSPALSSTTKETTPVSAQDLEGLDEDMKKIVVFLTANKEVQMATIGTDGYPAIRTIQFQFFKNGRIYFQTDTNASVYNDMQAFPHIEFVSSNKDHTQTLRVQAKVVFEYNKELLERVLNTNPNIKKIYGSADNPILTMFYIDHGDATIFEFSDKYQGTTFYHVW
jgi:uncharacterized pyridoxamine 5'-phosphate oxidase family protein